MFGQLVEPFAEYFILWIHYYKLKKTIFYLTRQADISYLLICYGNFALDDGGLVIAQIPQTGKHLVSLLVSTVVAYTAYPSGRVEVDVDGNIGVVHFDFPTDTFGLLPVGTFIATGKDLYAVARDLVDLSGLLHGRGVGL